MLLVLTVVTFASVLVMLHVSAMAVVAWALGAKPTRVSFFYGPLVFKRVIAGVEVQFASLPLGGYVSFGNEAEPNRLFASSRVSEFVVVLSGVGMLVLTGFALGTPPITLGVDLGWFLTAVTRSFAERAEWVRSGLVLLKASPMDGLGRLAMAFAAINLLPFPALNGGRALELLVGAVLRRPRAWRFPSWTTLPFMVVMLGFTGLMLIACVTALLDVP